MRHLSRNSWSEESRQVIGERRHGRTSNGAGRRRTFFFALVVIAAQGYFDQNAWLGPAGAVVFALVWFLPRYKKRIVDLLSVIPLQRPKAFVCNMLDRFSEAVSSGKFSLSMVIGVGGWSLNFVGAYVVVAMLGSIEIGVAPMILLFVSMTLGGAAAVLPGGFGTFEAAAVAVLTAHGYAFSEALSLAVALHVSQLVVGAIGALWIVSRERLGIRSLARSIPGRPL